MISEIEAGANYVDVNHERTAVVVAERDGRKFLRGDPERTEENSLSSFSRCS